LPFGKEFFDNVGERITEYVRRYDCAAVTLTIKAYDQEYNVAALLRCDDGLLTFAYYSEEQSVSLPANPPERKRESKAWPALTLPYECILWVEFNPGKADSHSEIGFKTQATG